MKQFPRNCSITWGSDSKKEDEHMKNIFFSCFRLLMIIIIAATCNGVDGNMEKGSRVTKSGKYGIDMDTFMGVKWGQSAYDFQHKFKHKADIKVFSRSPRWIVFALENWPLSKSAKAWRILFTFEPKGKMNTSGLKKDELEKNYYFSYAQISCGLDIEERKIVIDYIKKHHGKPYEVWGENSLIWWLNKENTRNISKVNKNSGFCDFVFDAHDPQHPPYHKIRSEYQSEKRFAASGNAGNKYKQAMEDLKKIGMALINYNIDHYDYPKTKTVAGLKTEMILYRVNDLPIKDPWGNDYLYMYAPSKKTKNQKNAANECFVGSAGSDGRFVGFEQKGVYGADKLSGQDILWHSKRDGSNRKTPEYGNLVFYPK
jgi:Type II secretion system (T2SS), protein G